MKRKTTPEKQATDKPEEEFQDEKLHEPAEPPAPAVTHEAKVEPDPSAPLSTKKSESTPVVPDPESFATTLPSVGPLTGPLPVDLTTLPESPEDDEALQLAKKAFLPSTTQKERLKLLRAVVKHDRPTQAAIDFCKERANKLIVEERYETLTALIALGVHLDNKYLKSDAKPGEGFAPVLAPKVTELEAVTSKSTKRAPGRGSDDRTRTH